MTIRRQRIAVWYDDESRKLRRLSRMLERRYRRTELPSDRLNWVLQEKERHRVNRIKENAYWLTCISSHSGQPRKLWRTFSTIMGLDKAGSLPISGPTAQKLHDYFVQKIENIRRSTGNSPPTTRLPPSTNKFSSFKTYSSSEVLTMINSSPAKSCSLDPVPTHILKEFLPELLPFVTKMCNRSLEEGWLPKSERHAVITPIIKKAGLDEADVASYRPISNLTFISKLVERMVCQQLTSFLDENKLLPKFQSGFRARHSTETAILKVMSDILTAADQGKLSLLGLLDMSAAFDTVDHDILLQRVEESFGFSGDVLSWLRSFLCDRTQQINFNESSSIIGPVTSGVPQGSVLGPLLFVLYTADVPLIAADFGLNIHCYADDGQLYVSGRHGETPTIISTVAACIAEIDNWMSSNRLKLNTDKTQFIWLGTRQQITKVSVDSIILGPNSVKFQTVVNNLGVLIDSHLTMKNHVRKVCQSSFYHLRQLRVVRRSLSYDACTSLVHAFVASRLDYCNSLLAGVGDALIRQLQSILRVAARLIMHKRKFDPISDDIRDKLHWLPVHQRIDFKLGIIVFKALHNEAPAYLTEMLTFVAAVAGRASLRSSAHGDLVIPRTKTMLLGKRSFAISGPTFWNSLPVDLKNPLLSLTQFKQLLKTFLFRRAYYC